MKTGDTHYINNQPDAFEEAKECSCDLDLS
jgi:hypothetical protein